MTVSGAQGQDRSVRCPWCGNYMAASILAWHMDRCSKSPAAPGPAGIPGKER